MKRTKKVKKEAVIINDGKIQWIKKGRGSLKIGGKVIKQNQKFWAHSDVIGKGMRDLIIPLSTLPEEKKLQLKEKEGKTPKYEKVKKSHGWYNVIDQFGKVVNEKGLREEDADTLILSLY